MREANANANRNSTHFAIGGHDIKGCPLTCFAFLTTSNLHMSELSVCFAVDFQTFMASLVPFEQNWPWFRRCCKQQLQEV